MSKNNTSLYNICDSALFCTLHDQLASLDRHAHLTRCFSAVAELLVQSCNTPSHKDSNSHGFSSDGHEFGGYGSLAPSESDTVCTERR